METADMVRLSASEVACYRWPEDTAEHRAMRAAFCDGAVYGIPAHLPEPEPVAWRWQVYGIWHYTGGYPVSGAEPLYL